MFSVFTALESSCGAIDSPTCEGWSLRADFYSDATKKAWALLNRPKPKIAAGSGYHVTGIGKMFSPKPSETQTIDFTTAKSSRNSGSIVEHSRRQSPMRLKFCIMMYIPHFRLLHSRLPLACGACEQQTTDTIQNFREAAQEPWPRDMTCFGVVKAPQADPFLILRTGVRVWTNSRKQGE
jgi:hypothetical protein